MSAEKKTLKAWNNVRRTLATSLKVVRYLLYWTGVGNLRPVRAVYNSLITRAKDPGQVAHVQGHKMFLDPNDCLNLSALGVFERTATELARRHIKRGNVVIDLGANIGYYTLMFARLVGPEGKVFAFEPEPSNYALLKRNIEVNRYQNVILVPKAVANRTGQMQLYLSKSTGDHRIYNSGDERPFINIEVTSLDDYFSGHADRIDFVKMDVQGAEGRVLQGMTSCLTHNNHIKILTEFWPFGLRHAGTVPEEFLKSFIEYGFSLYLLRNNRVDPVEISELLGMYDPGKDEFSGDLFCVKGV